MNIDIKITGGGNPQEVAAALHQVANDIAQGNYINAINERGECEWEDGNLMTIINEEIL